MLFDALFALAGLFVGWFFLPTPAWAKKVFTWLETKEPVFAQVQAVTDPAVVAAPTAPTGPTA